MRIEEKIDTGNEIINDVVRECISICNRNGYIINEIEIDFLPSNHTNSLAYFKIPSTKNDRPEIHISNSLKKDRESLKNTILHELAHYLVYKNCLRTGRYLWNDSGDTLLSNPWKGGITKPHGKEWKEIVRVFEQAIGQQIPVSGTDADYDEDALKDIEKNSKYIFQCKKCGNKLYYQRASKFTKEYDKLESDGKPLWKCSDCGGTFEKIKG